MICTAERVAHPTYSKLLPCRTRPYRIISIESGYAKTYQDGVLKTVPIKWLTRVAKGERSETEPTWDPTTDSGTNPRASCTPRTTRPTSMRWRRFPDTRTNLQGRTTLFHGTALDLKMIRSNPSLTFLIISGCYTSQNYEKVTNGISLQGAKEG